MGIDIQKALTSAAQSQKEEVKPNELVRKLMAAEAPSEILPFPRNGIDGKPLFQYRMRVLTAMELDGCIVDAERYTHDTFKKNGKRPDGEDMGAVRGDGWSEVFNNAKAIEILLRACRQIESKTNSKGKTYYEPLFLSGEQMRGLLTKDELAALFNAYSDVQFRYGPIFRMMSDAEVDAMVSRLEEGLDQYPLPGLPHELLVILCVSLASRVQSLKTGITSSGGLAEDGTSDELIQMDGEE